MWTKMDIYFVAAFVMGWATVMMLLTTKGKTMLYALILFYWTSGAGGPVKVAEYPTLAACQQAGEAAAKGVTMDSALSLQIKHASYYDCVKVK